MAKYCVLVIILLGGIVCYGSSELGHNNVCDSFQPCSCIYGYKQNSLNKIYSIQCPPLKKDYVLIEFDPDKYLVNIECNSNTEYQLDIVNDVHINIENLVITSCFLPMYKFKTVVEKFNTSYLSQLVLEECILDNNSSHVNTTLFDILPSLKKISMKGTNFEHVLFNSLTYLTDLYLEETDLTEIGYIFENNPKLESLHLSQNHITNLPDDVFSKLPNLEHLDIWGNALINLTKKYFSGLKNLRSLELSRNSIYHIDENAFSELSELTTLSLKENRLGFIASDTFKYNTNIKKIILDDNPNLNLSEKVFANLYNLQSVSIENCRLIKIPENTFGNSTGLTNLSLRSNYINAIPQKLFKYLTNLHTLKLSNNKLTFLSDQVFSTLKNLEILLLEKNHLTHITKGTFQYLINLKELNIKNNKISYIEESAFSQQKNLIDLNLSYNQLTDGLFMLSPLLTLQKLFLSHNKMVDFPYHIIEKCTNLKELDLSYNSLNTVEVTPFIKPSTQIIKIDLNYNNISEIKFIAANEVAEKNINHIQYTQAEINILKNPLICDCRNYELIQYFREKMNKVKIFLNIVTSDETCFAPQRLNLFKIQDLKLEQINCEYNHKDCPSQCKCFWRPLDSAVIIDCAFKNLTQFPTIHFKGIRTEINMTGNFLEMGPSLIQGYKNVKRLFLSKNKIKVFDWCPPYIEELRLDNNKLTTLNSNVIKAISESKNFSKLTLENNPWRCGCSAFELQNFINRNYSKTDSETVLCEDDNIPLVNKADICKSKLAVIAPIIIPLLVLFFISATLTALFIHFKQEVKVWLFSKNCCLWFVTEEELDKDKKYDIFLSFSHKDEDFVAENLVPSLEKTFKLCIHSRDFIPGELINDQIADSVFNSRRTLIVLSNNFLESAWGRFEFLLAHKQSIEERRPRVIVMKLGDLNVDKISDEFKAYFKTNTYVEWGEPWFWKKLMYALPHSIKNVVKNNQKHANMMLKIDDKFDASLHHILHPGDTPVISLNSGIKQQPLRTNLSNGFKPLQFEVPLITKE